MAFLLLPVLLLVFALIIVGAYYASRSLNPDRPFRYRVTPFNILAGLMLLGALLLFVLPAKGNDGVVTSYLSLYLLGGLTACLLLDLILQLFIRSRKTLYMTEAILLVMPFLAYVAKWFLGTGY